MNNPVGIDLPPQLDASEVGDYVAGRKAVLCGRIDLVAQDLPALADLPRVDAPGQTPAEAELLVIVGGGMRIDAAKAWRGLERQGCALLAIPTRHGSGAEANDIAILDDSGNKHIQKGPEFRPDARAYAPCALDGLSDADLLWCAGDTLTHAVEGFLSPLAKPDLRLELAGVLKAILSIRPSRDPFWFELSAAASAGQAQASVGLVHGIAHSLEAPARAALGEAALQIGHARLCSALLAPVLRFNLARSDRAADRLYLAEIDQAVLLAYANALSTVALDLPLDWSGLIEHHWKTILRDVCTRTNVATVRPGNLSDLIAELARW